MKYMSERGDDDFVDSEKKSSRHQHKWAFLYFNSNNFVTHTHLLRTNAIIILIESTKGKLNTSVNWLPLTHSLAQFLILSGEIWVNGNKKILIVWSKNIKCLREQYELDEMTSLMVLYPLKFDRILFIITLKLNFKAQ